jgi:beta-xylosidase
LKERPGFLRLKTNRVVDNLYLAPNTLTQRMEGPTCSGSIAMDISKMKDGDCAGLAAFNGDSGVLTIKKQGKKSILEMSEQKVSLTDREKAVTNVDVKVIETVELPGKSGKSGFSGKIYLRLDGDFQPGHHDVANFYYSLDGENWTQIGTKDYRMIFDYRRFFMGTKFGIFNYATKKAGGYVDVDEFKYSKSEK